MKFTLISKIAVLSCVFAFGHLVWAAEGAQPKTRVACIGDSIVYGAGVENREQNNWPRVLGDLLGDGWEVHNFGVNGATMLKQADFPYRNQPAYRDALALKPDVVIISLGGNDSKHPSETETNAANNWQYKEHFVEDYQAMIQSFRAVNSNATVYVCIPLPAYPGRWGINDLTIRQEVTPLIRQVAQQADARVVNLYAPLSGKPELFPDTVHPNAAGARIIASILYGELAGKKSDGELK